MSVDESECKILQPLDKAGPNQAHNLYRVVCYFLDSRDQPFGTKEVVPRCLEQLRVGGMVAGLAAYL